MLSASPIAAPPRFDTRWLVRLALGVLAAMLAWNFGAYVLAAGEAITFPFELDYGEGLVWQQMTLIFAGRGYGQIDGLPAIVFHYPPLYHLVVGQFSSLLGADPLATGRVVSIVSTLIMAAFVAAIAAKLTAGRASQRARRFGSLLAAAIVFSLLSIQFWSVLMRVDMLSFAFTFAGFYFGLRALDRPQEVHIAAILFVAAVFTKQTALAAPTAVFSMLLFLRPRAALSGIASGMALALTALGLLMSHTEGRFLRHVLLYNVNRVRDSGLVDVALVIHHHLLYLVPAFVGIYVWQRRLPARFFSEGGLAGLRARLLASPADAAFLTTLLFFVISLPMLLLATKSGSSVNYFIEWGCLVAILAGPAFVEATSFALGKPGSAKAGALLAVPLLLLAGQVHYLLGYAGTRIQNYTHTRAETARLVALVKAAPGPIVSDDMVILMRGGKSLVIEPSIYAELTGTGVWSEQPLLDKIAAHEFAFFVSDGKMGQDVYDSRYSRTVAEAIHREYPVERKLGRLRLQFPAGSLPAYAADLRRAQSPNITK